MKKLAAIGLSFAGYFSLSLPAFAQAPTPIPVNLCPGGGFGRLCKLTTADFGGVVAVLIQVAFVIAVIIALGFLIFGGIKWITSGGDKTGVEGARNTIVASIVGLVIVFLAFFIINIILGFFGLDINKLEIPSITGTKSISCTSPKHICRAGGAEICCKASQRCGAKLVGASIVTPICK